MSFSIWMIVSSLRALWKNYAIGPMKSLPLCKRLVYPANLRSANSKRRLSSTSETILPKVQLLPTLWKLLLSSIGPLLQNFVMSSLSSALAIFGIDSFLNIPILLFLWINSATKIIPLSGLLPVKVPSMHLNMLSPQPPYYVHWIIPFPISSKLILLASLILAFLCKNFPMHSILLDSFPKRSLKPNEITLPLTRNYLLSSNLLRNGTTSLKALPLLSKFTLIINCSKPSSQTNSYPDDKLTGLNSYLASTSQLNIFLENGIELMVFLDDLNMICMAYIPNYRNHFYPHLCSSTKLSHFLPQISWVTYATLIHWSGPSLRGWLMPLPTCP